MSNRFIYCLALRLFDEANGVSIDEGWFEWLTEHVTTQYGFYDILREYGLLEEDDDL